MKHRLLALLLFTFALPALTLRAQEATPEASTEGWPIVERCIGDPAAPPADWTFDGTIFAYREGEGLRALRADVPTTYFVAFDGSNFTIVGSVSPDGQWFAVPAGRVRASVRPIDHNVIVDEIRVYPTNGVVTPTLTLPWNSLYLGIGFRYPLDYIFWWDNDHFIYYQWGNTTDTYLVKATYIVNALTGEMQAWSSNYDLGLYSIDRSQALVFDDDTIQIFNVTENEMVADIPISRRIRWTSDFSYFALSEELQEDDTMRRLVIYNGEGNLVDEIFGYTYDPPQDYDEFFDELLWSPDNNLLVFSAPSLTGDQNTYHIADIGNQTIVDMCIPAHGEASAWSPDSSQILFARFSEDAEFQIIDLTTWERYIVAADIGWVVAWRPTP